MKQIIAAVCLCVLVPSLASANYKTDVDRNKLGGDIVQEFSIPVLFYEYESAKPDFGDSRGGGTRSHEGQDFIAPLGSPIVSPTEAIVIQTGVWNGGGNYVRTANPGGEEFRYMHLDGIAQIESGDWLDVGDLIGTVGDTGNAAPGQYHLHFEVRNANNQPQDPYPRLSSDVFSDEEVADFLDRALDSVADSDRYAAFLLDSFSSELAALERAGETLPRQLRQTATEPDDANDDDTQVKRSTDRSQAKLLAQLQQIINSIPSVLRVTLREGDDNIMVSLLQTYLSFTAGGPAAQRLADHGPTGYYGPLTKAAVRERQVAHGVAATGVYDTATRDAFIESAEQ